MAHDRLGADEITVRDGDQCISLVRLEDGWHFRVESDIEGKIFDGRVTELSELLVGHPVAASALDSLPQDPA